MDFVIIVPAYKPTSALVELLSSLREATDVPILVIDDGSGPDFGDIFERCVAIPRVSQVRNAINLGKGAALKHGLNHALLAHPSAQSFVTADADGQHRPRDILAVAAACEPDAMVLGARAFDRDVPLKSKIGNTISRFLYRLISGISLRDTQTGLRGLPRRLAEQCLPIRSNRYEFETEQLIIAKREGFRFKEIGIETVYLDDNRGTHFDPILDSFRIYFVLLRYTTASITTALVDFAMFTILMASGAEVVTANLGGRAIALLVQYYLLQSFVFKVRGGIMRFVFFVLYVAVMGFVSSAVQLQLSAHTGVGIFAAKIVIETILFVLNFLFLRDLLFVRKT